MPAETLRLFLAVNLPDAVRVAVHRAGADHLAHLEGIRIVAEASLHLTLAFLGARPREQVETIASAVGPLCAGQRPFTLSLAGPGCFPSVRRPRVLWVGLSGEVDTLRRFQSGIEGALARERLYEPERNFRPHLTIARVGELDLDALERLGERWSHLRVPPSSPFDVQHLDLMHSELGRGGARYSVVRRWRLGPD